MKEWSKVLGDRVMLQSWKYSKNQSIVGVTITYDNNKLIDKRSRNELCFNVWVGKYGLHLVVMSK